MPGNVLDRGNTTVSKSRQYHWPSGRLYSRRAKQERLESEEIWLHMRSVKLQPWDMLRRTVAQAGPHPKAPGQGVPEHQPEFWLLSFLQALGRVTNFCHFSERWANRGPEERVQENLQSLGEVKGGFFEGKVTSEVRSEEKIQKRNQEGWGSPWAGRAVRSPFTAQGAACGKRMCMVSQRTWSKDAGQDRERWKRSERYLWTKQVNLIPWGCVKDWVFKSGKCLHTCWGGGQGSTEKWRRLLPWWVRDDDSRVGVMVRSIKMFNKNMLKEWQTYCLLETL